MISDEVQKIAKAKIKTILNEAVGRCIGEAEEIRAEHAGRGVAGGMVVGKALRNADNIISEAVNLSWNALASIVETAELEYYPDVAEDLFETLKESFPQNPCLLPMVKTISRDYRRETVQPHVEKELDGFYSEAFKTIRPEIDIFSLRMKNKREKDAKGTQITIRDSVVGSIHTGANSIAYNTQNIDARELKILGDIFAQIETFVAATDDLPTDFPTAEVVAILQDGQAETRQDKPNLLKLKGYISSVGTILSGIATAKDVYELLRGVAADYGLELPLFGI